MYIPYTLYTRLAEYITMVRLVVNSWTFEINFYVIVLILYEIYTFICSN